MNIRRLAAAKLGSRLQWVILAALSGICLTSWTAVCVGFFVKFTLGAWTGIVTMAAVTTEVLFWALAAAFGVTVIQARRRLWVRSREICSKIFHM